MMAEMFDKHEGNECYEYARKLKFEPALSEMHKGTGTLILAKKEVSALNRQALPPPLRRPKKKDK
jgi:hypothetical protein